MERNEPRIFDFGPFRLITDEGRLFKDGQQVSLTPKAFDLLLALVSNPGRLLTKQELLDLVWPDSFVEEANLSVKMSELRRALGEGAAEHKFVETVPRRGYRFVAGVKAIEKEERATTPPTEPPVDNAIQTEDSDSGSTRRYVWVIPVVAAAVLIVAAVLIYRSVQRYTSDQATDSSAVRSLAVLPLDNLSGDAQQDYFAEGMTEALITDLAKLGKLRVISRQTVMQYKGTRKPLSEIGRELNVDALLTGSVVRAGDRVRISVQLSRTPTENSLWTQSYERDLRDVLALQSEVTRDIVGQIRIKLTPQEQLQFGSRTSVDAQAYDQYLRGKFFLNRQDRESNESAVAALESAVRIDPNFAAGYAELAQAYVWKLFLFSPDDADLAQKAYVATEHALSLDPDLASAHLARGRLLWTPANHFPHEKAIREYRRALELNPNLDEARNQLALVYNHVGLFDDAMRELERAVETNPSNSLAQFRIGETLLFQGRYEQSLTAFRGVPGEANPSLVGHQVVWALWNLGRADEAASTLDQYLAKYPEDNRGLFTSLQAVFDAAAGRYPEAEQKIRLAIEKGNGFGHFHHTAFQIACAYARMNKPKEAVEWLEKAANDGFPCYPLFENDPNLRSLKNDPAYISFMSELKGRWESFKAGQSS